MPDQTMFSRQRRNLILISIILVLVETTNVNFKQLNLIGNIIEIGNPEAVIRWLWVAFTYLLWRYYIYFSVEKPHLTPSFLGALGNYALDIVYNRAIKSEIFLYHCNSFIKSKGVPPDTKIKTDKGDLNIIYQSLSRFEIMGHIRMIIPRPDASSIQSSMEIEKTNVTSNELFIPYVKSTFYVFFKATEFGEYFLPLFLALAISYIKIYFVFI